MLPKSSVTTSIQQLLLSIRRGPRSIPESLITSEKRKGRGSTVAAATWVRDAPNEDLKFNEYERAIFKEGTRLHTFIGTLAKKSDLLPLCVSDWWHVMTDSKDVNFQLCKEQFKLDERHKGYVLEKVTELWRKRKKQIKGKRLLRKGQPLLHKF